MVQVLCTQWGLALWLHLNDICLEVISLLQSEQVQVVLVGARARVGGGLRGCSWHVHVARCLS